MENFGRSDETKWRFLSQLSARLATLTPLWLLLLAPPLIFPDPTRSIALLGLPLLMLIWRLHNGHFFRRTPLDWLIFIVLAMTGVAIWASFSLEFSLDKLAGLLFHIVVFYAVVQTVQHKQGVYRSLVLYLLLGMAVVGVGLIGTEWLFKVVIIRDITQRLPLILQGLPGAETGIGPNQLAGTLLWCFPVQLSLLWGFRHRPTMLGIPGRLWWPALALACMMTLFVFILTQSRGGWLGGAAAVAFLLAMIDRRLRWGVLAGIGVAGVGATLYGWRRVAELLVSDTTESLVGNLSSLGFRQEVWQAAVWGIADFPFTGMGLGTFREVVFVLYPINVSPTSPVPHAHNQFLQIALDLGLLGLAAFIGIWLGVTYMLGVVLRHNPDAELRAVALGVAAALLGFFVYGITDTIALGAKPGFFLWWLFALTVGLYQQTQNSAHLETSTQGAANAGQLA